MAPFNCTSSNFYSYNNVTDVFTCKTLCISPQFNGIDSSISATVPRCESSCSKFIDAIYTQGQKCYDACPTKYPYYDANNNCTTNCSNTSLKFFPNATSGACLASCGSNSFYYFNFSSFTFQCWNVCSETYVYGIDKYDKNSQRCALNCNNFSVNNKQYLHTCINKCPEEQPYYANYICTNNCSSTSSEFFPNASSGACSSTCSSGYYYVKETEMRCWQQCAEPLVHGIDSYDSSANRCAESCFDFSETMYIYQQFQCVESCKTTDEPYYDNNSACTGNCFTTKQIFTPNATSGACLDQCPTRTFYYYQKIDAEDIQRLQCWRRCQPTWFSGIDVFDSLIPRCAETCYGFQNSMYIYLQMCLATCPEEAAFYDQSRTCTNNCSLTQTHYFPNSTNGACLVACPQESYYYAVGNDIHCWPKCLAEEEYFYGIDPKFDYKLQRCAASCSDFSGPMITQGQQCIFACSEESPFYDITKQCFSSCSLSEEQKFTPNVTWGLCVTSCKEGFYLVDTNYFKCWKTCPSPWFYGLDIYDPTILRCAAQCTDLQSSKPYYFANLLCTANCYKENEYQFIPNATSGACLNTCGSQGFYSVNVELLHCWASCEPEEYYGTDFGYDYASQRCVASCSDLYYSVQVFTPNDTSRQCLETCGYTEQDCYYDGVCNAFYYINGINFQCWKACDYLFGFDPTYDLRSMRCTKSCSSFTNPAYSFSPFCLDRCSMVQGFTYDYYKSQCVLANNMSTDYFISISVVSGDPLQVYEVQNCTKTIAKFFPNSTLLNYCNYNTSYFYFIKNSVDMHIWIQCSLFFGIDIFHDTALRCADSCTDFVSNKPYFFTNNSCTASCSDPTFKFFPNATSGQCLSTCGNNSFYFVSGSDLHCWASCEEQMLYGFDTFDNVIMRCAASCSDFSTQKYQFGQQCLPSCPQEQPFFTNFVCTSDCSQTSNKFFPNSTQGSCLSTCEEQSFYYIEGTQQHCWASCEVSWFYGIDVYDPSVSRCAVSCLDMKLNQPYHLNNGKCTANCSISSQKFFPNATSGKCLTTCGSNDFYYINGFDLHCWVFCDQQMFYGIDSFSSAVQRCAASCLDFEKAQPYYFSNNTCIDNCSTLFIPNASTGLCLFACSQNQYYFVDNQELHCWATCDGKWLSGIDTYSPTVERCAESCKDFNQNLNKIKNKCVPHKQYEKKILSVTLIPIIIALIIVLSILTIVWWRRKVNKQMHLMELKEVAEQNAKLLQGGEEVP